MLGVRREVPLINSDTSLTNSDRCFRQTRIGYSQTSFPQPFENRE